jgi:hypothetical protein
MAYLSYGKKLRLMILVSGSDTMVIPVAWRRKRLPRYAMLHFAGGREAKTLLGPALGLHLGHFCSFSKG